MTRRLPIACALALLLTHALATGSQAQGAPEEASYATLSPDEATSLAVPEKTGSNHAAAAEEFARGRELVRAGEHAAACKAFERSRQLNTTVAVLLNLGLCYRQLGRFSTAHRYYRRAEVLATLSGDRRRDLAHDEASTLAQLRATLSLRLSEASDGLEVRIDGVVQPGRTWAQPMFIDAGEHAITIQAPGKQAWQGTALIRDGEQHSLIVPALAGQVGIAAPHMTATSSAIASDSVPLVATGPAADGGGLPGTRVAALVAGGAGIAGVGLGLFFGGLAQSEFSDSDSHCAGDACHPPGLAHRERALAHATRATVFTIAGAVALAGGVILWLASPNDPRESPPLAARAGYLAFKTSP